MSWHGKNYAFVQSNPTYSPQEKIQNDCKKNEAEDTTLNLTVGAMLTFNLFGPSGVLLCCGGTGGYIAPQTVKKSYEQ